MTTKFKVGQWISKEDVIKLGEVRWGREMMNKKLVCGVGINDADYIVTIKETIGYVDGKLKRKLVWICPFYRTWKSMIQRGYSSKFKETNPTYKDCYVTEEWYLFSNFKQWMEQQKWENNQLDKDILFEDNKEYSKDTCIFVPQHINLFLVDGGAVRGEWPLGVDWNKNACKFQARCRNGKGQQIYLGLFNDQNEAHLVWKSYKHELAIKYADELEAEGYDSRLVEALKVRYL